MFHNLFIRVGLLILLTSPISAQENNLSQLLNSNEILNGSGLSGAFVKQFSEQISKDDMATPTSKMPNMNNSHNQTKIIDQLETKDTSEEISKIEQYYEILTSKILPVFGQNSFAIQEDPNLLFYNTVDRTYQLAPADVINVTIRGQKSLDKKVQISSDGTIILPGLQPIYITGYNLDLAEEKLLNLIRIDDFSATVSVSLQAARLVPVQITGAARKPRTIAVPAYTPLSRLIPLFGGIKKSGSFRNIALSNLSNDMTQIDLYHLLRGNNDFTDHLIKEPTRLHINDIGLTVATSGFVGREGIFELKEGSNKISISEILMLSNTKMIPPGSIIQILKFDQNGIVQKQNISTIENQYLNSGEVLSIELRQTKNTNKISVKGAVLKGYEIYREHSQSLAKILKFGAALQDNAILDFAIIKSQFAKNKAPRSVDLRFAFENPDKVLVKPGETVIILNAELYNYILANFEHNKNKKTQANGATTTGQDVENTNKSINPDVSGDQIINTNNILSKNHQIFKFLEIDRLSRTTQKIYIDDTLSELIPDIPQNSAAQIIQDRVSLPRDLNLDFAIKIENLRKTNRQTSSFAPKDIFSAKTDSDIPNSTNSKANIKLFTNQYLISILTEKKEVNYEINTPISKKLRSIQQNSNQFNESLVAKSEIELTQPLKIYIDNELSCVLSNNTNLKESICFERLTANPNIYPFFVRGMKMLKQDENHIPSPHYDTLFKLIETDIQMSKIEFFTHKFVRQVFENKEIDLTTILEQGNQNLEQGNQNKVGLNEIGLNQTDLNKLGFNPIESNQSGANQKDQKDKAKNAKRKKFEHIQAFKRNSKLISGALEKPGFYPIIGNISLENVISLAGGLLPGADLNNVTIRQYGLNSGRTSIVESKYIDILSIHPKNINLHERFTVHVPFLENNSDVGSIELEGEILHPGKYTFSRSETLKEVIDRAGGFTETAYPLGASFYRESLKIEQKISNENLAREVEQSILFLSQSQLTGAGDQIKAVVAYANQLKSLPASGKQTLNLEGSSRTMLLENGDKLRIPKRPSHVTISGSVQNPVTTVYEPQRSLEDYISDAGGLKRNADKKSIFVLLPNGKNITLSSLKVNSSLIPAGSVIVVPPKTDKISALGLTDIWSRVLGNIATSILAINAATK